MSRETVVAAAILLVGAMGCVGRPVRPAPTAGHIPEPIPPVMVIAPPVVLPTAREVITRIADSAVASPTWRNARWGVLIVDATTGDTLYAHDADKLFMPASNQKLLTTAIALQVLGPEYRWKTPIVLQGIQRGKVFRGNLGIAGHGDPSVSDAMHMGDAMAAFEPIVGALMARGITRITGDVVALGDAFAGPTTGFGWEIDDNDTPSGAAVDELLFNEGLLHVVVRGATKAGKKPTVQTTPTTTYPRVLIDATTRLVSDSGARIAAAYDSVAAAIRVTGTIPVGDSARISISYRHPVDAYRAALRERLRARGITVDGNSPTKTKAAREDTLTTLESPTLREVLPILQKPSQNQIAELFFRTSGLVATGSGDPDSARAVSVRTLAAIGISNEHAAYRDGSGLSRHDYVTPRALVQVLDAMHRAPWAELYRSALPLAGVDGTITNRMKNTPAASNASAKTGTLDKARSLSGYVNTADGHVVIFSMLCNSFTMPNREVERVQDLLVSTLAGLRVANGTR